MRMVLLRHGQSEANVKKIYAGHLDVPLTEKGREQAEQSALFLGRYEFKEIYSSPLDRAYETAYLAGRLEENLVEITKLEGLMEMSFGECEGLSYEQIKGSFPEFAKSLERDHLNVYYPSGESLKTFYERICACYEEIKGNIIHTDHDYLIVAHSGVIRALLAKELTGSGEGYWHYKVENCGYAVLEYSGVYPILAELNNSISLL